MELKEYEDHKMPRFGAWASYPLSKAAFFLRDLGWNLKGHVVVIGNLVFCVLWREKVPTEVKEGQDGIS